MPKPAKTFPTRRLTLETSEEVRQRMEMLRDATKADSITEVIRRALAVYEMLFAESQKGQKIILRDGRREREVLLVP